MTAKRYTADSITDDALDELYENANRGWRRGDEWKARAEKAEAAIKRADRLARRWAILRAYGGAAVELRKALAEPKENSTP
ncbi:hypothetical protein [Streptomyces sp. NPDC050164]|uniref:hypothetical protein n=1 Tax=Streptomyces sp. NPDC050164 TaxID=3365605 RepID=UPI0037919D8B